jgi:hypothetical protein
MVKRSVSCFCAHQSFSIDLARHVRHDARSAMKIRTGAASALPTEHPASKTFLRHEAWSDSPPQAKQRGKQ